MSLLVVLVDTEVESSEIEAALVQRGFDSSNQAMPGLAVFTNRYVSVVAAGKDRARWVDFAQFCGVAGQRGGGSAVVVVNGTAVLVEVRSIALEACADRLALDQRISRLLEEAEPGALKCDDTRHALSRWASVLVRFSSVKSDCTTLRTFGRAVGISAGCFRNWCRTAGVSPRDSLAFARVLRAVVKHERSHDRPEDLLDSVDVRTITKLLRRAGGTGNELPRTVSAFLERQTFVRSQDAVGEVGRLFERTSGAPTSPPPLVTQLSDKNPAPIEPTTTQGTDSDRPLQQSLRTLSDGAAGW